MIAFIPRSHCALSPNPEPLSGPSLMPMDGGNEEDAAKLALVDPQYTFEAEVALDEEEGHTLDKEQDEQERIVEEQANYSKQPHPEEEEDNQVTMLYSRSTRDVLDMPSSNNSTPDVESSRFCESVDNMCDTAEDESCDERVFKRPKIGPTTNQNQPLAQVKGWVFQFSCYLVFFLVIPVSVNSNLYLLTG